MRNILLRALLLILTAAPILSVQACDICGSGGDNAFGLLPTFNSRFVGLRYQFRHFSVEHPTLFASEQSSYGKGYYQNAEIWGRYGFAKNKLQLYASLPFHYNIQNENGINYKGMGLGDAQLMLQGLLFNSSDSAEYKIRQSLLAGAGIKLATGAYRQQSTDGIILPAGLQPGSGSFDIPFNLLYTLQYRKVGINTELNYRINTKAAKTAYKVGNRLGAGMQFLYRQKVRNNMLLPYLSLQYEYKQQDLKSGFPQEFTGGQALLGGVGMECFLKTWSFGLSAQHPLWQNLAGGYVQASWQAQARVLFLF